MELLPLAMSRGGEIMDAQVIRFGGHVYFGFLIWFACDYLLAMMAASSRFPSSNAEVNSSLLQSSIHLAAEKRRQNDFFSLAVAFLFGSVFMCICFWFVRGWLAHAYAFPTEGKALARAMRCLHNDELRRLSGWRAGCL